MDWKWSEWFVVTFEGCEWAFIIKIPICFHYNGANYWWHFASDVLWMSDYAIIMIKQHLANWFPLLTVWSLWECVVIHAYPFFSESNGGCYVANKVINTSRPREKSRHFADDNFERIFLNEYKISLKFAHKGPINNILTLGQIMAWCRPGDKPLSEPIMVSLLTHICLTRSQWVNSLRPSDAYMRQAIIWTNDGILLIRTLRTNFSEILSEIHSFSFKKMHFKMSSAKWRLFRLGLNGRNDMNRTKDTRLMHRELSVSDDDDVFDSDSYCGVIIAVADGLASVWRQAISNQYDDVCRSAHFRNAAKHNGHYLNVCRVFTGAETQFKSRKYR